MSTNIQQSGLQIVPGTKVYVGEITELRNETYGCEAQLSRSAFARLTKYRASNWREVLSTASSAEQALVRELLNNHLLVESCVADLLQYGFVENQVRPSYLVSASWADVLTSVETRCPVIVGLPLVAGGSIRCQQGPAVVYSCLDNSVLPSLRVSEADRNPVSVIDYGRSCRFDVTDVAARSLGVLRQAPGETADRLVSRYRYAMNRLVASGHIPVTIGGDHTVTFHAISEVCERLGPVHVVHVDAHHDMYSESHSQQDIVNHANVMAAIDRQLPLSGLTQLGLGTIEVHTNPTLKCTNRCVVSAAQLSTARPGDVLSHIDEAESVYLSIDVDVLAGSVGETSSPCVPGIEYVKIREVVQYLSTRHRVVGYDFVEFAPRPDREPWESFVGQVIAQMVCDVALAKHFSIT